MMFYMSIESNSRFLLNGRDFGISCAGIVAIERLSFRGRVTVGQATDAFLRGTLSPPDFEGRDPSPKTGPDTPRPYLASPIGAAYQQ